MIDKKEAAIFKSKQDFNQNKENILEYIKYAENWQVTSVISSIYHHHIEHFFHIFGGSTVFSLISESARRL